MADLRPIPKTPGRRRAGLTLLLAAGVAGGCSPLLSTVPETRIRERGEHHLVPDLAMPQVRGVDGCGAQALATALAYENPAVDPAELAEELPWHDTGATPVDLLLEANLADGPPGDLPIFRRKVANQRCPSMG